MRVLARWLLGSVFLLFCAGSVGAKTQVFSKGSKELKVVITEDMAQRELEADSLRKAREFDAAIEGYQGLIDECQGDERFSPQARLSLKVHYIKKIALCYRAKGDYQKALEQYEAILAIGEKEVSEEVVTSALLAMGRLALTFGRCDGVAQVFESRKQYLPDELLLLLGDIYQKAGRDSQARQTYLEVLESHLGPRQDGRVVIGCYGVPPEEREPLEQEALERAEDLASGLEKLAEEGNPQAQLLLGELAWEQGDYNKALAQFQKAWTLSPKDPLIGLQIARTFIALNSNEEALNRLKQIGSLLNGPGELLELATAYQLAADPAGARTVLQKLVAEHPESPEAREAHLRLQLIDRSGL
ncbi:MAG: hypothetical protein DRQ24_03995 [Candidatus Latescibacterota bacterium]|nr:MAG: hypothetical protein DRQ24_03995 [Candidatus Latescibacterota bacterium]